MPHLSLALAAALLGLDPQAPADPPPRAALDAVTALEATLVDAIARAEPSVVAIARDKDGKTEETTRVRGRGIPTPPVAEEPRLAFGRFPDLNGLDGDGPDYVASDYGSGVVIGTRGEILTAFSVVRGASRLLVRAAGVSVKEFDAEVVAADPRSDLAVIAPCSPATHPRPRYAPLPPADLAKLRPLPLGDASKLRKGNFLLAFGNPFNSGRDGQAAASWGILANIARRLDSAQVEPRARQLRHYPTLLQLDAKLNLGMSGGAVINLRGELVGLTTAAANAGGFDAQAGYALPVDGLARRAIEALRDGREVEYGFLGIGLSPDGSNRVDNVTPGTPAAEGGLVINDAILSIGGLPVTDLDSLVLAVNAFAPGAPIKVRVRRDGHEAERTVILSKLPIVGEVIATSRPASWRGLRVDFVSTSVRSNRGDDVLGAMARGGVVVSEVQPGSAAEDAELKPGQVVTAVEDQPVRSPAEFAKAVADRPGNVTLRIEGDQRILVKP